MIVLIRYATNDDSPIGKFDLMIVFVFITLATLIFEAVRVQYFLMHCVTASRRLFEELFGAILAGQVSWFERTPSGRILQRLSTDTNVRLYMIMFH